MHSYSRVYSSYISVNDTAQYPNNLKENVPDFNIILNGKLERCGALDSVLDNPASPESGDTLSSSFIHSIAAAGYYGPPHFVMLNSWTPWQSQGFQHSVRSLPVWVQPAIPHTIHPYVTSREMMYGAAPQMMQTVQVPNQISEPHVSTPHSLPDTETAKEVKAEVEKTEPSIRGRTRKREGIPVMRKKRKTKGEADEGVSVEPQVGMPVSQLRERITESVRVFHCLGEKTRERGPFQASKDNWEVDSTRKPLARSGDIMLPQSHERGKRKRIGDLGFQGRAEKKTFSGDGSLSLPPSCSSDDTPAGSVPQLSSPSLAQNGCSQNKFHFVLEESTPIQPWQREEREAMRKKAQREREQAARVTKMGVDYILERLRWIEETIEAH